MIIYKKGDLLEAPEDIIAHGCNAVGGFGSGVAGQIAKKYPEAKYSYKNEHEYGSLQLGYIDVVTIRENLKVQKRIINCVTQQEYLPRGICHANYDAINECMLKVKRYAKAMGNLSIAIPKIGCGLAGGDWQIVEKILEVVFYDYNITVYEK